MKASIFFFLLLMIPVMAAPVAGHPHILSTNDGGETPFAEMVADLGSARLVFLGEIHNQSGHHRMQLEIIRFLHDRATPVAIGLEMFAKNDQEVLDRWVTGEIGEEELVEAYQRNWYLWSEYMEIFAFAREHNIPLVALNIPRIMAQQVARRGANAVDLEALGVDEDFRRDPPPAYLAFLRQIHSEHPHGIDFENFCAAQFLWDSVMAANLLKVLDANPDLSLIVLAGNGHSWKHGIPYRVARKRAVDMRVVLPEDPGRVDRTNFSTSEADYLWLDFGEESWQP